MADKLEPVEIGSFVVLSSGRFWFVGDVVAVEETLFKFKVYDSYNENFKNAILYGYLNEIEYVENA